MSYTTTSDKEHPAPPWTRTDVIWLIGSIIVLIAGGVALAYGTTFPRLDYRCADLQPVAQNWIDGAIVLAFVTGFSAFFGLSIEGSPRAAFGTILALAAILLIAAISALYAIPAGCPGYLS